MTTSETGIRKSAIMTKSVHYQYDIEYVKHYNYYDSECLDDSVAMQTTAKYEDDGEENVDDDDCGGRQNLGQESIIESDSNDGFVYDDEDDDEEDADPDVVPELQEVSHRSFSFTRVSIYNIRM